MSNTIVAKFKVMSVKDYGGSIDGSVAKSISLQAVDGKENESWSKCTPSGAIEIYITNKEAADFFVPKESVILTFSKE